MVRPDASRHDEKPPPDGAAWAVGLMFLLARIVASPLLSVRKWRGPRCESLAIRWLGVAAVFPVWAAGGGGSGVLLDLVWGCLALFTLVSPFGWRKAVAEGRELSSTFVGIPLVGVVFRRLQGTPAYLLEPVQWLVAAVLFGAGGQPGWATYFVVAGVVAAPLEALVILWRDRVLTQDVIDARIAQQTVQDAVNHRLGR